MSNSVYTCTVAFTTPSGRMHLGHGLGHSLADVVSRYESLTRDQAVFFPIGIHATGKDLVKIIDKLHEGSPETFVRYNISKDKAQEILDLPYLDDQVAMLVSEYNNQYAKVLDELGVQIDMDGFFSTHEAANHKYTQWTLRTLDKLGLIVDTDALRHYCTKCDDIKAIESDFSEVQPESKVNIEDVGIQEGFVIMFEGQENILPVYTTRPETVFGVTNLYYNKSLTYVAIEQQGQKPILVDEEALEQLVDILGIEHPSTKVATIKSSEYLNSLNGDTVALVHASFVASNNGTGFVMSVPSHDPYDAFYLRENYPGILTHTKTVIVDSDGNPISFNVNELDKSNLEEIKTETYRRQENGIIEKSIPVYGGLVVPRVRSLLLQELVDSNKGGKFYRVTGGSFRCRSDGSRIIARRTRERAINYADEEMQETLLHLVDAMKISPSAYKSELKGYIRTRRAKPLERAAQRTVGAPSPFDSAKKVEALADSNIYMEFYGIAKLMSEGTLSIDNLNDDLFDYLFRDEGNIDEVLASTGLDRERLDRAQELVIQILPVNINVAATEHKDVHFPFSLFTHAAVLPKNFFPEEYFLTSLILSNGEKMSKSKGNVVYLDDLISDLRSSTKFPGVSSDAMLDSIRYFFVSYQSLDRDFDWNDSIYVSAGVKYLKKFVARKTQQIESLSKDLSPLKDQTLDDWLESGMHLAISDYHDCMKRRDLRKASIVVFSEIDKLLATYRLRGGNHGLLARGLDAQLTLAIPFTPRITSELLESLRGHESTTFPTPEHFELHPEHYEEIQVDIDTNYLANMKRQIEADMGKMMGRKEIKRGDAITIATPSSVSQQKIIDSPPKVFSNFDVEVVVQKGIREPKVLKKD